MKLLPIRYYGDPILVKTCTPVDSVTSDIKKLIDDMIETMHFSDGVGLAAPQVGIGKRIVVIDTSRGQFIKDMLVLINPEILYKSTDVLILREGCLGFPNIQANIERPKNIKIKAEDRNGKEYTMEFNGILSRIIQHEIDHLNGILLIDKMGRLEKSLLLGRLRKLRKQTQSEFKSKSYSFL